MYEYKKVAVGQSEGVCCRARGLAERGAGTSNYRACRAWKSFEMHCSEGYHGGQHSMPCRPRGVAEWSDVEEETVAELGGMGRKKAVVVASSKLGWRR